MPYAGIMKTRQQFARAAIVGAVTVVVFLSVFGTGVAMKQEGLTVSDLWDIKKGFIKTASPEAGEAVDIAEDRLRATLRR
jgi:hypothetical protein